MKMASKTITQSDLKNLFRYRDDGSLIRTVPTSNRVKAGDVAGTKDKDGYIVINLRGKQRKAHHLVWLYHYGYMPKMIDHINRNKSDNRIENLRLTNKSLNAFNSKIQSNNTSGCKGVSYIRKSNRWESAIKINGKKIILGYFKCLNEAVFDGWC